MADLGVKLMEINSMFSRYSMYRMYGKLQMTCLKVSDLYLFE